METAISGTLTALNFLTMLTYEIVILLSWAAFLLVWIVAAFNVKRDIRGGFGTMWRQYWVGRIAAAILLLLITLRFARGEARRGPGVVFAPAIFPHSSALGWLAALCAVAGVSFAIWARMRLGRNWSPRPAVKEQHELVTTGPYAYVRHPIYTGVILMALGTALTGSVFGVGVLIISSAVFLSRIRKEEKIMLELFPGEYPAYRQRTKRLVPFVW